MDDHFAKVEGGRVVRKLIGSAPSDYELVDREVQIGWVRAEGGGFEAPEPASVSAATLIAQIKLEAERRILEIMPSHKQRNATARGIEVLFDLIQSPRALTSDETTELTAGLTAFSQINHIRQKSNELEAMDPIPHNFKDDSYWD